MSDNAINRKNEEDIKAKKEELLAFEKKKRHTVDAIRSKLRRLWLMLSLLCQKMQGNKTRQERWWHEDRSEISRLLIECAVCTLKKRHLCVPPPPLLFFSSSFSLLLSRKTTTQGRMTKKFFSQTHTHTKKKGSALTGKAHEASFSFFFCQHRGLVALHALRHLLLNEKQLREEKKVLVKKLHTLAKVHHFFP